MTVDSESAAAHSKHDGRDYWFCSDQCKRAFDEHPERYVGRAQPLADAPERESSEPPFTKSSGMTSPKFGSAGSGGAEYEGPDRQDRR